TLNILMSFAEFEREMIAERTRDKIAASRRKGKWTGGSVPFGYVSKEKRLALEEHEGVIVREAFDLFIRHKQMVVVARVLKEKGVVVAGMRKERGLTPGGEGTKDCIWRVQKNPLYWGLMRYGDEVHRGDPPAIIDEATYRAAQAVLVASERDRQPRVINHDYV